MEGGSSSSAEGDTSEDDLGHLASNVAFLIWADKNGVISQGDFDGSMEYGLSFKGTGLGLCPVYHRVRRGCRPGTSVRVQELSSLSGLCLRDFPDQVCPKKWS